MCNFHCTLVRDSRLLIRYSSTGDLVNRWRTRTLDLEPITDSDGPKLLERLAIPHTYCWSPALVPRPNDWPSHIGMHDVLNGKPMPES